MKILLSSLVLILAFQTSFGQENQNLRLFDSASDTNCESLYVRLDGFNIELHNNPSSIGYILIQNGENQLDNVFYYLWIKRYFSLRNISQDKIRLISVSGKKQINFEFWISPNGDKPNFTEESFTYKLNENQSHYFVEESVQLDKIDGKSYLIGDCPACCIRTFSYKTLANFLNANQNLDAKIIIYTKTSRKEFNKVVKLIVDEFTKERISRNRLKFIFGKKKEGLYLLDYHISVLDISLIPKKKLY